VTPSLQQQIDSRIDALTPHQRIERAQAMFQWTRELLGRQIVAEMGAMSAERLKWEVARRQYGADPVALAMIERKLADVSC